MVPYAHISILMISTSEAEIKSVEDMLFEEHGPPLLPTENISEAKKVLIETDVDLIIIDARTQPEESVSFALEIIRSKSFDVNIIMLIKKGQYETNLYQAERMGVVAFKEPLDLHLLLQTIRLLLSVRVKIKKLENRADNLQKKLDDDHLTSRAKLLLMEHKGLTEQDAHHCLEKEAMERCVKKIVIAREIIRKYRQASD